MIRVILYIVIVPFSIFALDSIRIEHIFKGNHVLAARLLYLFCAMGLSYLVVNFLMDFFLGMQMGFHYGL